MEAVIKLTPSELTEDFFGRLKLLVKNSAFLTIRIQTDPFVTLQEDFETRLTQLEEGKVKSFSMDEFEAFVTSK